MSKGEHFSTPDDLAHFEKIGASTNTTGWMQTFGATHHYKYPQSVGADSVADNINFNSHDSSKYAKKRMTAIDEATHEPYMLFEFMKIREDKAEAKIAEKTGVLVIAIKREEELILHRLADTVLEVGDVVYCIGEKADLEIIPAWFDPVLDKKRK